MKISFIVIGRNEGWKLEKCLKSIFYASDQSLNDAYEVIYVDSKSSDNSIQIAKQFKDLKVFEITGHANSAIARNIGAQESKGKWLFFIDGDMEIDPDFVANNLNGIIKFPYFTGQVLDYLYDKEWGFLKKKYHYKQMYEPTYMNSTGGVFIINKVLWDQVRGMRSKYKRSQDLDLSLRLSKAGHQILRLLDLICVHHTISHSDNNRMWANIWNFNVFYNKSLLLRDHLFNKYFFKSYFRQDYTMVSLLVSILFGILVHPLCFLFYPVILIVRSAINTINHSRHLFSYFLSRLGYHLVKDFLSLILFFAFYPKNYKIEYRRVD